MFYLTAQQAAGDADEDEDEDMAEAVEAGLDEGILSSSLPYFFMYMENTYCGNEGQ